MNSFTYTRAEDVGTALREIARDGGRFIAGGTNLLDLMKENVERPARLIDITRLPLNAVEETPGGGLKIGVLVPNSRARLAPTRRAALPAARACDPLRCLTATAQHGVNRRQPRAAYALHLLLRHRDALQQT